MTKLTPPFYGNALARFELIQETLVPRSSAFTQEDRERSREVVNSLLSTQPPMIIAKIKLFMVLIEVFTLVTQKQRFGQLIEEKREQVLRAFFDSPVPIFRKGFWGLNTLARLGVYGQTAFHNELGYDLRSQASAETDK